MCVCNGILVITRQQSFSIMHTITLSIFFSYQFWLAWNLLWPVRIIAVIIRMKTFFSVI